MVCFFLTLTQLMNFPQLMKFWLNFYHSNAGHQFWAETTSIFLMPLSHLQKNSNFNAKLEYFSIKYYLSMILSMSYQNSNEILRCLFPVNVNFPVQAIKSVPWNFMSFHSEGCIFRAKLKFINEQLIFGGAFNGEGFSGFTTVYWVL